MRIRIRYSLLLTLALWVGAGAVYAGYPPTLSVSRVPREDWTYDALALLAARELVPGKSARHFYGDWLYTRREMAEFIASAVRTLAAAPDDYKIRRSLVARLVNEFRPELDRLGLTQSEIDEALRGTDDRPLSVLILSARYWLAEAEGSEQDDITADRETFAWSRTAELPLVVIGLSNQRREFRAEPSEFPRLQNAFVQGRWHEWVWGIGQEYLWWGTAYSGSMILSDNAPPFTLLQFGKDFSLGRLIGRLRIDEVIGPFDDEGTTFYFAGRRFEKTLSDQWNLAVNEAAKMRERPNPLILVLPFYAYQHLFLEDIDAEFNALYSLEVSYRFKQRAAAYFEYLIDDITAPGFLRKDGLERPRRIGWLAGIYHPLGENTSVRGEYVLTDVDTYISARPEFPQLSYTHDGFIIGHPVGPNSSAFFFRVEHRLSTNLDGVIEYIRRNGRDPTGPNPGDETAYCAFLSYGVKPRAALWLRAQRFLGSDEDRLQLGASYTF